MSLALLVVMVVVGVSGVVLIVHLTGGSVHARLADETVTRTRFAVDYPEPEVTAAFLTAEGEAAFLALADGRVGIVQAIGSKFLTRIVAARDLAEAPRVEDASVTLHLRDFTWPGGVFTFAGAGEARAVEALLLALREPA